jgi:hypothetical protein
LSQGERTGLLLKLEGPYYTAYLQILEVLQAYFFCQPMRAFPRQVPQRLRRLFQDWVQLGLTPAQ